MIVINWKKDCKKDQKHPSLSALAKAPARRWTRLVDWESRQCHLERNFRNFSSLVQIDGVSCPDIVDAFHSPHARLHRQTFRRKSRNSQLLPFLILFTNCLFFLFYSIINKFISVRKLIFLNTFLPAFLFRISRCFLSYPAKGQPSLSTASIFNIGKGMCSIKIGRKIPATSSMRRNGCKNWSTNVSREPFYRYFACTKKFHFK